MTPNATHPQIRALIADDERLMREQLQTRLTAAWPELVICGSARDGNEAVDLADSLRPDVVFLDIRMPGLSGIDAAREIVALQGWAGHLVFVTAYDEYAVPAFERGALDYLLKPVEPERLAITVQRLKTVLAVQPRGVSQVSAVAELMNKLAQLQTQITGQSGDTSQLTERLRWVHCGTGSTVKLVAVEDVLFFRSDEKYTRVQTKAQEALIRVPIRELVPQLDPAQFWQIHRSTIVNLGAIASVQRDDVGRQRVHLKDFPELLEVSRSFGHLFRQS